MDINKLLAVMLSYNCSDGTDLILKYLPHSVWRAMIATFTLVIAVAASVVNGFILFVLFRLMVLKKTKPFHKILASLALSDLLAGITVAPILFAQLVSDELAMTCTLEKLRFYMLTITVGSSICTLGFISYDRYLHMVQLFNYTMPTVKLYAVIFVCWIIPIIGVIVHALLNRPSVLYGVAIVIFLAAVTIIVVGSYVSILIALRRVTRHGASSIRANYIENERRTGKTVLIILTSYVIMIAPLIVHYSMLASKRFDYFVLSKTYVIAVLFSVSNSIVNPLIIANRTLDIKNHILGNQDVTESVRLQCITPKHTERKGLSRSISQNDNDSLNRTLSKRVYDS